MNRTKIFQHNRVAHQFIDGIFIALKNRFLSESETVKRAAIIFLLSKVYFTDEMANSLRLRITAMEWDVFSSYIEMSKQNPQYLPIFIMINHLLSCNFFSFTVKNKYLALESGAPEVDANYQVDLMRDRVFWDDLSREIEMLEKCKIVELKQLESIHDKMMKPFQELIPESRDLKDALEIFNEIKKNVLESQPEPTPNLSRREALAVCDTFIKSQNSKSRTLRTKYDYYDEMEMSESDDIISEEFEIPSTSSKKSKKRRKEKTRGRKSNKKSPKEKKTNKGDSTSDSESDTNNSELRKITISNHQSVINGISVEKYSQRLKECYKND